MNIDPQRIYDARLRAGLTQADVAFALRQHGLKANERSVNRWETGKHTPHANVIPLLAEALGVEISDLYVPDKEARDPAPFPAEAA